MEDVDGMAMSELLERRIRGSKKSSSEGKDLHRIIQEKYIKRTFKRAFIQREKRITIKNNKFSRLFFGAELVDVLFLTAKIRGEEEKASVVGAIDVIAANDSGSTLIEIKTKEDIYTSYGKRKLVEAIEQANLYSVFSRPSKTKATIAVHVYPRDYIQANRLAEEFMNSEGFPTESAGDVEVIKLQTSPTFALYTMLKSSVEYLERSKSGVGEDNEENEENTE